jgi:hypothetical protein
MISEYKFPDRFTVIGQTWPWISGNIFSMKSVLKGESFFDRYFQWPSDCIAPDLSSIRAICRAIYQWMCLALDLREAFSNTRFGRTKAINCAYLCA